MLYVVGGFDGSVRLNTAERFDIASNSWAPVPPMSTKRNQCAAAAVGGLLCVVGGYDRPGWSICDTAECFDPVSNTWTPMPIMPTKWAYSGAAPL